MPAIAIIGAGFSGSMLAVQLLRHTDPAIRVILIEKRPQFGRGVAYATDNPFHLLNVPAGKMSAFAADPNHFVAWLDLERRAGKGQEYGAGSFVPRRLYGDYIESILASAAASNPSERFIRIIAQAVALEFENNALKIRLHNGMSVGAGHAVLALGNFPPLPPAQGDWINVAGDRYLPDPWQADALEQIPPEASVALVGAGLTMVDIAIALVRKGHRGPIHAISRHGLQPRRHSAMLGGTTVAPIAIDVLPLTARQLLRTLRHYIQASGAGEWRGVIDAMRPATQQLWSHMPSAERARFLRHLQARWDVHRHRLAPEVAIQIDDALASGQLRFHAGQIEGCGRMEGGLSVRIRQRGGSASILVLPAQYVINCTGPASDYSRINDPLMHNLLAQGWARSGPQCLGLDVDRDLRLIAHDGKPLQRLYAVGPVTKGALWEITAVPDLRIQVAELARHLTDIQCASSIHHA